jgi:hypothetical protein
MRPGNDTRVAGARQRLAECPGDPQLVSMPQHQLARLAVRLHGAAQLLHAHVRDQQVALGQQEASQPRAAMTLDPDQAVTVIAALEDATALRREAVGYCLGCRQEFGGLCYEHAGSLDAADEYDALRWQLQPAPASEPPPLPSRPFKTAASVGRTRPGAPGHRAKRRHTGPWPAPNAASQPSAASRVT